MPPSLFPSIEFVLYRLSSAALAVEGLMVCSAMIGAWIFKPDYIKSRSVVGALILLTSALSVDRGLAAAGHPLGALGLGTVALLGLFSMVTAIKYHRVLSDVPKEDAERAALRQATAAMRSQVGEITGIWRYSEQTLGAMESVMHRLKEADGRISNMRTLALAREGADIRLSALHELLHCTPLMYLAWDSEQRLILAEGRDLAVLIADGDLRLGQAMTETAYAGTALVEFVASTLKGATSTCLFEGQHLWWAAHYYPREGGGAVVAIPLSTEEIDNVRYPVQV